MSFFLRLVVNALAMWLTTLIVPGVRVDAFASGSFPTVLTYLLVALIFAVVNAVVGTVIRVLAAPIYLLTLGLFALIVNGLLLLLAAWVSSWFGFGLQVNGFWSGVWGALLLGIFSWLIGLIIRPARNNVARNGPARNNY